ncbi:family 43 glycosylhydrolase [Tenggerimyces flavus]|uniref:Family 43 glycosylhydrolase n=1 Tax=Tenggerimyces flavus TaxID=1708749 RepID=A0ABV7YGG6_9ACTN|nr:family 43 glycosylhydrolase [Tenggerimyces flavus]MBM7791360.1 beta-xylosidase [Tenggerimyces flavus]
MTRVRVVLVVGALLLALLPNAGVVAAEQPVYTNPVADEASPNFADPSIIRGRDGYWYAYATADPKQAGDTYRLMKIIRSRDLTTWEYVGDVFTPQTEPRYDGYGDAARRMYWAPDIEYFGGRYVLYYSYVVNVGTDTHWRAIGVATAPHPAGPWTDSGAYVTGPETYEPRPGQTAWRNVIDPDIIATANGDRYLYYGSVNGGVRVVKLSPDGLTAVGERTQLTPSDRYEAADLVFRDGYYYLFLSVIGGCCNGAASAYPVHVARSKSPRGPFLSRDGVSVLDQKGGGTPVQVPNGNRWVSVGHTSVTADLAGQQWLVSHAIDRYRPYYQGTANNRQLVISRLDWIRGWPTANAGRGIQDGPLPAPVADAWIADSFESGTSPGEQWADGAGWTLSREPAGGFLESLGGTLFANRRVEGDVRLRGMVRGAAGFVLERGHRSVRVALPPRFANEGWHQLDVRIRGRQVTAEVSDAGLGDVLATVNATLPGDGPLRVGLSAKAPGAAFDDVTVARLFQPVTHQEPDPRLGRPLRELDEEFKGALGPRWSWQRTPAATVANGQLRFAVQRADLVDRRPNPDDSASVLLTDAPAGDWALETKVTVPFGDSVPLGWPQAGVVMYGNDDHYVNFTYAAHNHSRLVDFGTELPWGTGVVSGGAQVGPTADTMWLRLLHTVDDATGEHRYRAATSTNGRHWIWHGARVLPAGATPRIGLAAYGIESADELTASFEYVRFSRLNL